ncbi:uncharacterized protein LOC119766272 [Culex quinquefasciatus]|uniref:uncharacterized protein LOC119766272 n=1 Tax=Culex quinquefasciatus TaxID=7176 RepID=UPI0018E398C7|nr:uncharacterized protein LOC119766272 [Culex quinquefasciatus]
MHFRFGTTGRDLWHSPLTTTPHPALGHKGTTDYPLVVSSDASAAMNRQHKHNRFAIPSLRSRRKHPGLWVDPIVSSEGTLTLHQLPWTANPRSDFLRKSEVWNVTTNKRD